MKKIFLIGLILLIVGIVWAFAMNGIGTLEWLLLLFGFVIGILAGVIQGWAIAREKRGLIGPGKRKLLLVGTIIVFIALKVSINVAVPSYIATSANGIWLSIVIAVDGLLLGRSLYSRLR